MKRVLIVAGETSGDLHGASLMRAMHEDDRSIEFRGIGGTRMIEAGLDPIRHVRDMNFMGFIEVVRHLPFILRTFRDIRRLITFWKPDIAILIDYPGFNLKLAPELKHAGIPVMYYISPQLWAWHRDRVKLVKKYIDRMVVLFAFERDFYREYSIEADFVGHPLIDLAKPQENRAAFRKRLGISDGIPLVGLLPGSRNQEIDRIIPMMTGAVSLLDRPDRPVAAVLGCAPEIEDSRFDRHIRGTRIHPLRGSTYDLMAHADVLVVTSGTATLESAILGAPMVIVYKTSPLTFMLGKMLVHVDHIGMINIVAGSRIVPELWQDAVTPAGIAREVDAFLDDPARLSATRSALGIVRDKLGPPGAAGRAAAVAYELLERAN
jgi:lipid-A-disaccharide synthase